MDPGCRALQGRCRPTPRVEAGPEVIAGSEVEVVVAVAVGPRDATLVARQYQWSTMMAPACYLTATVAAAAAAAGMGDGFGRNW